MKKQSGFTLIELMVVMAIIAILATAGLSAYTGYIKKARDATRIADLHAINNIVLASMSTGGIPPTFAQLEAAILAANNDQPLRDPLHVAGSWSGSAPNTCIDNTGVLFFVGCGYTYDLCDGGSGYIVAGLLESPSNKSLLTENLSGAGSLDFLRSGVYGDVDHFYDLGSCRTSMTTWTDVRLFET